MHDVASLVETYLAAERNLVAAVESAGGAVPLPDGRAITVGRAEFDALLGQRVSGRGLLSGSKRPCRRGGDRGNTLSEASAMVCESRGAAAFHHRSNDHSRPSAHMCAEGQLTG
jgi:hypothetical protein